MKNLRLALCAALIAACLAGPASAQRNEQYRGPPQRGFAPESESDDNSLSWLLSHGYQIVAGWDGTLVLQRQDRVYLCPISRYRSGNQRDNGTLISQMCQHVREGVRT